MAQSGMEQDVYNDGISGAIPIIESMNRIIREEEAEY